MTSAQEIDVPAERAFAFVEREMGFGRRDLVSRSRRAGLVRSRAMFAVVLARVGVSKARIAKALHREQFAAANLVRVGKDLLKIDPTFAEKCARFGQGAQS